MNNLYEDLAVLNPKKMAEELCSVQPIDGKAWNDLYQLLLKHGPMIIVPKEKMEK